MENICENMLHLIFVITHKIFQFLTMFSYCSVLTSLFIVSVSSQQQPSNGNPPTPIHPSVADYPKKITVTMPAQQRPQVYEKHAGQEDTENPLPRYGFAPRTFPPEMYYRNSEDPVYVSSPHVPRNWNTKPITDHHIQHVATQAYIPGYHDDRFNHYIPKYVGPYGIVEPRTGMDVPGSINNAPMDWKRNIGNSVNWMQGLGNPAMNWMQGNPAMNWMPGNPAMNWMQGNPPVDWMQGNPPVDWMQGRGSNPVDWMQGLGSNPVDWMQGLGSNPRMGIIPMAWMQGMANDPMAWMQGMANNPIAWKLFNQGNRMPWWPRMGNNPMKNNSNDDSDDNMDNSENSSEEDQVDNVDMKNSRFKKMGNIPMNGMPGFGFNFLNGMPGFGYNFPNGMPGFGYNFLNGMPGFGYNSLNGMSGFGFNSLNGMPGFGYNSLNAMPGFGYNSLNGMPGFG